MRMMRGLAQVNRGHAPAIDLSAGDLDGVGVLEHGQIKHAADVSGSSNIRCCALRGNRLEAGESGLCKTKLLAASKACADSVVFSVIANATVL